MKPIVYTVVGRQGRWFVRHTGGRFGPLNTRAEALALASAARAEGESRGLAVVIEDPTAQETPGRRGQGDVTMAAAACRCPD